jgi:predicted pyridoxine 5'-phosphate oxidase superfamily flavin-nucleotide-binding protein
MTTSVDLDAEYRLTRAALANAGVEMTDSIDALYRDWRQWRQRSGARTTVDRHGVANADRWWAHHLAQFRSMIDPVQVAARAERARKQRVADHARMHRAGGKHSPPV